MSTDDDQKNKLLRLIKEGNRKSQEIMNKANDLTSFGQQIYDLSFASEDALKYIPASEMNWEPKINAWKYVNTQEDEILGPLGSLSTPEGTASGATGSYYMADLTKMDDIDRYIEQDKSEEAQAAIQRLSNVIDRQAEKHKVLTLLKKYGLHNSRKGQKSPLELFEIGWAAFEKPVTKGSPASTSLIPIRECLNSTIVYLLSRRPIQESARNWHDKILSITRQLSNNKVTEWAIESLSQRCEELINELSASKKSEYTRNEWSNLLKRASLFIQELLESIDISKI